MVNGVSGWTYCGEPIRWRAGTSRRSSFRDSPAVTSLCLEGTWREKEIKTLTLTIYRWKDLIILALNTQQLEGRGGRDILVKTQHLESMLLHMYVVPLCKQPTVVPQAFWRRVQCHGPPRSPTPAGRRRTSSSHPSVPDICYAHFQPLIPIMQGREEATWCGERGSHDRGRDGVFPPIPPSPKKQQNLWLNITLAY